LQNEALIGQHLSVYKLMCLCCVSSVWVGNLQEADIHVLFLGRGGGVEGSCKTPSYSGWKRKINSFWYQYLVHFLLFPNFDFFLNFRVMAVNSCRNFEKFLLTYFFHCEKYFCSHKIYFWFICFKIRCSY
jgi:hypothetical protein